MIDKILSRTKIVEKALDGTWLRNEAIAQNLANIDTPGYKRKTVNFEEHLNKALDERSFKGNMTHPRHIPIGRSQVEKTTLKISEDHSSSSVRLDGNNVDIENEMAAMAKNTIQYNTLIQSLSGRFKALKTVINEGRR